MNTKIKMFVLSILLIFMVGIIMPTFVQANVLFKNVETPNETAEFMLKESVEKENKYKKKFAYSMLEPGTTNNGGSILWNILKKDEGKTGYVEGNIFCIDEGLGFPHVGEEASKAMKYNKIYNDMESIARDELSTVHPSIEKYINAENNLKNLKVGKTTYESINRFDALIELVKLFHLSDFSLELNANQAQIDEYMGKVLGNSNVPVELNAYEIKAVEQAAIWLFTDYQLDPLINTKPNPEKEYNMLKKDGNVKEAWVYFKEDRNSSWTSIQDYMKFEGEIGIAKQDQMSRLYEHLVYTTCENVKNKKTNNNENEKILFKMNDTQAKFNEEMDKDNYIVGPFQLSTNIDVSKLNDIKIEISINNKEKGYILGKLNGQNKFEEIQGISVKDFNNNSFNFYVKVPKTEKNITLTGNVKITRPEETKIELWVGDNKYQPMIIPTRKPSTPENFPFQCKREEKPQPKKKVFDLALRKYITKINGVAVKNSREPQPQKDELANGTKTTARYEHRKDPLIVKKGDKVVYRLQVYNEGEKAGRPLEIKDQLPRGLKYLQLVDKENSDFTSTYDEENNILTLSRKVDKTTPLDAFNPEGQILDSEYVDIECEVTASPELDTKDKPGNPKVLTNVAWISKEIDDVDHIEIINQEKADRDSVPAKKPDVNQDNMSNYIGAEINTGKKLDNPKEYFEGQEDDDDFEKLILLPESFDLKLIKRITEINGVKVIRDETGLAVDYEIDVSKLNIKEGAETTAVYKLDKTPVLVKQGDIVTYTFRIYNEGTIDGYANQITENIPEGLEFIQPKDILHPENDLNEKELEAYNFNNKYGWVLGKDEKTGETVVRTDYLSVEKDKNGNLITAFGENDGSKTEKDLHYLDVPIKLKVVSENVSGKVIRNEACITDDKDKDGNNVDDRDSKPEEWKKYEDGEYEDDEDFDNIILQSFDLALRKFIIGVSKDTNFDDNDKLVDEKGNYIRAPKVDTSKLNSGEGNDRQTTAIYNHPKDPVKVNIGDYVIYNFRIYNEGEIDGYATEIRDILPEYLDYVDCEYNRNMGWELQEDKKTVKTNYLKDELIKKAEPNGEGYTLSFKDVSIMCQVNDKAITGTKITNIADISKFTDGEKQEIKDRDSEEENVKVPEAEKLPEYKDEEKGDYVPGQQDDDDFEKVIVNKFDLALRKYITKINGKELTDKREPIIDLNSLKNGTTATYKHRKDPLLVKTDDIVTYNLTIYNEGEKKGRATKVVDQLPEGLEFSKVVSGAFEVKEDGYDKETNRLTLVRKEDDNKNLEAFNGKKLDSEDIVIECKVTLKPTADTKEEEQVLTNVAWISEEYDSEADVIITDKKKQDIDSEPATTPDVNKDNMHNYIGNEEKNKEKKLEDGNNYFEGQQDDDDFEKLIIKKFDLALRKWVTQAIVIDKNGETITETGHKPYDDPEQVVKVELHKKKLNDITVKFRYSIRVINEGQVAGYVKEITDYVPEGLKFVAEDNKGWKDEGNNVISTTLLENKLLQPGEYADVEVVLTWINNENNLGVKVNTAEISKDDNEYDLPDIDSTPDNKVPGEDDIDDAPVALSIITGRAKTYIGVTLTILIVIAGGITLIKKYVL